MTANVLVIGGGGREHAICWKLAQSTLVQQVFVAPGNVGIIKEQKVVAADINIKDFKVVAKWCLEKSVSLVVVGPEDPLDKGISDSLASEGILCFGPKQAAVQIESNKDWAKSFMDRHGIPTARWKAFNSAAEAKSFINKADFPALVVKASGLAAGKGVVVAESKTEACEAVDAMLSQRKFGEAGDTVVIEETLQGEEVSVLGFCDGSNVRMMLPAQDHKRLLPGDIGPNTGGMGAYCPCPFISKDELYQVEQEVLYKALQGLKQEKTPFVGVLYAGLMMTKDGPKVLEFNCRFGDPETEVILPLLETDLYEVMLACCKGELNKINLEWKKQTHAVGVVLASKGYPASSSKGQIITGVDHVCRQPNSLAFHCGTTSTSESDLLTNGGRVLVSVAMASELASAAARATQLAKNIQFDGVQFRPDIAHKGILRGVLKQGLLTYKASGVDIVAGDSLVSTIKPAVNLTKRPGCIGSIGGFGGLFDLSATGYKKPILVSGTDGVGTKLKVAQECNLHETIGIDLVAMCVNDILAHAAEPLFFLDYFACGQLEVGVAAQVVKGVAEGCQLAGCGLVGGETAEMPGIYAKGDYDLAGFTVGAVESGKQLPLMDKIQEGDLVLGLLSSGLHSNGFSLVRKIMEKTRLSYSGIAPFSQQGKTYGEEFLIPTRIYVKPLLPVLQSGKVKAFAHITGGGILENIPRVLPEGLVVELDAENWPIPTVFGWLAAAGQVNEIELLRTFNCGIGAVLIVCATEKENVSSLLGNETFFELGKVTKSKTNEEPRVKVHNFTTEMEKIMRPFLPKLLLSSLCPLKKKVGVLISGSGTNLQALLDYTSDPTKNSAAEIVLVISNKEGVEGLKRAEKYNIPTKVICHKKFGSRLEFDRELNRNLREAGVELICLAGFMRILTAEFVKSWRGHLINIHPALLPLFKGTHAHRQALDAGVTVTGCTVHFVEEEIDAGAILVQQAVPILRGDTEDILQERVKKAEHLAYPQALEMLARDEVYLDDHGRLAWN